MSKKYGGSFSKAFSEAHKDLGAGEKFSWNGKEYTTDRDDGRDLKAEREQQGKEKEESQQTTDERQSQHEESEHQSQSQQSEKYSGSFNEAFAKAHSELGAGQNFSWQGKEYTTDRDDGRDLKVEREQQGKEKEESQQTTNERQSQHEESEHQSQSQQSEKYSGSFNEAFAKAHSELGAGQKFIWQGTEYTTDRDDGRDLKVERQRREKEEEEKVKQDKEKQQQQQPKKYSGSFNEAFSNAHKELGAGKKFIWNNKEYTTDRSYGRDLKAECQQQQRQHEIENKNHHPQSSSQKQECQESYVQLVARLENGVKNGYKNGRFFSVDPPEQEKDKKTKDIGYGHKITDAEARSGVIQVKANDQIESYPIKEGLTDTQALNVLRHDLRECQEQVEKRFKTEFKGEWEQLSQHEKDFLTDYQYNVKNFLTNYQYNVGTTTKFPKMIKGFINADINEVKKEYERSWVDKNDGLRKPLGRNKPFGEFFFPQLEIDFANRKKAKEQSK